MVAVESEFSVFREQAQKSGGTTRLTADDIRSDNVASKAETQNKEDKQWRLLLYLAGRAIKKRPRG